MPTIKVSSEVLRQKARNIRNLVDQRLSMHTQKVQNLISSQSLLTVDFSGTHTEITEAWDQAAKAIYQRYYNLAARLEEAAAEYEGNEVDTKSSFQEQ